MDRIINVRFAARYVRTGCLEFKRRPLDMPRFRVTADRGYFFFFSFEKSLLLASTIRISSAHKSLDRIIIRFSQVF